MSFNKEAEKNNMRDQEDREAIRQEIANSTQADIRVPRSAKMAYMLKPGFAWNPLLKVPRNILCPCGSGTKFKNCHLPKMPRAISEKLAAEYNAALRTSANIQFIEDEKDLVSEENSQPNP